MCGEHLWNVLFRICLVCLLPCSSLQTHTGWHNWLLTICCSSLHDKNTYICIFFFPIIRNTWILNHFCLAVMWFFFGQPERVALSPHTRWAASPSCACFLTHLKGCVWHRAILPVTSPRSAHTRQEKAGDLATVAPCPRPLPPRRQQKVCWSDAMPGTMPATACDVTADTSSEESSDWLRRFAFLTSWEIPPQQPTDTQTKLIITLFECYLTFGTRRWSAAIADRIQAEIC